MNATPTAQRQPSEPLNKHPKPSLQRTVEVILIGCLIMSAIGLLAAVHHYVERLWQAPALRAAEAYSDSLTDFRAYYARNIVTPLLEQGIEARHDYKDHVGAIPLPATLTIEMGQNAEARSSNASYKLVSNLPFPWRKDRQLTEFERKALTALQADEADSYAVFTDNEDGTSTTLRYARPVVMQHACVACHNTHPDSPYTNWRVGDVRGIQEVELSFAPPNLPLLGIPILGGPSGILMVLTGFLVCAIGGLAWLLHQKRAALRIASEQASEAREQSYQKQAALEKLAENERRSRTIINVAMDGVILMDQLGIVVDFNPAAEAMFGYKSEEIIGQVMSSYIIPEHLREAHERGLLKYMQTGEGPALNTRLEMQALHANGTHFPVELSISEVKTPQGVLFVGYIRDITQRHEHDTQLKAAVERAETANKVKSEFLAIMSHEIRTPINGVMGLLGLLKDSPLDQVQSTYVDKGLNAADHLLNVVNDILDFSKIEAGRMELEVTDYRLADTLTNVCDVLKVRAEQRQEDHDFAQVIDIKILMEPDVPDVVQGDPGRLSQILMNLGNNAVKFTDYGAVTFHISTTEENGHSLLKIAVIDTGIGIPRDKQDQLFTEFSTIDPSHSRQYGGTGLGLAISRRLIALMDGTIGCKSDAGKGSTFWITLPLKEGSPENIKPLDTSNIMQEAKAVSHRRDVPIRILLAEDNPTNRMVAKNMIESVGFRVDTASNGEEALKAVETLPYDLVLMDISMPVMDGLTATRLIRKLDGRKSLVPIIAMSAHVMNDEQTRFLDAGMNDVLPKPERKERIIAKIMDWTCQRDWNGLGRFQDLQHSQESGPSSDEARPDHPVCEGPYLDVDVLDTLGQETSFELLPTLIDTFLTDAKQRVSDILSAIESKDWATAELNAHALGSSAATFGAISLHQVCRKIEAAFQAQQMQRALSASMGLDQILVQTVSQLRAFATHLHEESDRSQ